MNRQAILSWFTGKARTTASHALDLLEASVEAGAWVPRASVKVKAALTKPTVIIKLGRSHEEILRQVRRPSESRWTGTGARLAHDMRFGLYRGVDKYDFSGLRSLLSDAETLSQLQQIPASADDAATAIDAAERWGRDFAPLTAIIDRLDASRPVPVFTVLGVSPTVTRTLEDLGVVGSVDTLRVCPIDWQEVERVDPKTGKITYVRVGRLRWPPGTVHGASRHAHLGSFTWCEACRHAIRNPWNWVPLLVDKDGVPHSLWTGRDCARNLFGIDVKGEVELEGVPAESKIQE